MLGFYAANESGPHVIRNSCTGGPRRSHCTAGACTGRRVEHAFLSLQRRGPGAIAVTRARHVLPGEALVDQRTNITALVRQFNKPGSDHPPRSCPDADVGLLVLVAYSGGHRLDVGSTVPACVEWQHTSLGVGVQQRSQVGLTLVAQRVRMGGGNAVVRVGFTDHRVVLGAGHIGRGALNVTACGKHWPSRRRAGTATHQRTVRFGRPAGGIAAARFSFPDRLGFGEPFVCAWRRSAARCPGCAERHRWRGSRSRSR